MARRYGHLCLCICLFAALQLSQAQPALSGARVDRLDPALDNVVPVDAQIEKIASGFVFGEGPVWDHSGFLLFSDIPGNVILKLTPDGRLTSFRKPSGYDGTDATPGAYVGSNGLTLDHQGRLTICETGNRRVTRVEKDGKLTVLADRFEGKRLNSPNDLVYKSDGALYFTDPPYGLPKGEHDPKKELPFSGVFRIAGGKLQLLTSSLNGPNGLAFSPDEKYLYVDNSDVARKIWMRFELKPDGSLDQGNLFYDATPAKEEGVPDGMKVDRSGNVYSTGPGGLWILSPAGVHLGTIVLPELPANCAWGDADGKTLYMTARTGLYRIRLKIAGVRP